MNIFFCFDRCESLKVLISNTKYLNQKPHYEGVSFHIYVTDINLEGSVEWNVFSARDLNESKFLCLGLGLLWDLFEGSIEHPFSLPSSFYKLSKKDNVTFYGGSFNPLHAGHKECLRQCPEDNIVIVPDYNPWKDLRNHLDPYEEFKNLVSEFKETSFSVYPGFLGLDAVNPTMSWITNVCFDLKSLLIGDDNFRSFYKWSEYEKLCRLLSRIYVVPRSLNTRELEAIRCDLLKINPNLKITILDEHSFQGLSSTTLRKGN